MVWSYKEKYNTDSKFRAREQKRKRDYGRSSHGRTVKRANYDKHMKTEKGYLGEKWNAINRQGKFYKNRTRNYQRRPIPVSLIKSNMSIDRIDSSQGYTKDNIVFCTWDFNDRKGNISLEDIRCILNLLETRKHEME